LNPADHTRFESLSIEKRDAGECLTRSDEEIDLVVLLERLRGVGQHAQASVEEHGRSEPARDGEHVAAHQVFDFDATQIDRGTRSRESPIDSRPMTLQAAHSCPEAAGEDFDFLPNFQFAVPQRTRDDRAEARDGENTIDRQARLAAPSMRRNLIEYLVDHPYERIETIASHGRDRNDRYAGKSGVSQRVPRLRR
jgi:hypothetical protein